MEIKEFIDENLEEDIISQIYYNDLEGIYKTPQTPAYEELTKKIREMEKEILESEQSEQIKKYMEYVNERCGLESENQFKIGFKTAVKIILESLL